MRRCETRVKKQRKPASRSVVSMLGGDGDDDQDDEDQQPVAADVVAVRACPLQRGPGAFLVDVDALLPAAAAFAVPLAVFAA
jgi:hypothetical protein